MLRSFLLLLLLPFLISAEYPCPDGLYNILGVCRAPFCVISPILPPCITNCPAGQWPSQHLCHSKPHCIDNTVAMNGTCLYDCQTDPWQTCSPCKDPKVHINGACKRCPPGTSPTNNKCPFDCPKNTRLAIDHHGCVPSCGWSQKEVNGTCQNICPTGEYLYGKSECRTNCDKLFYFEDLCVEVCPAGFIVQNGNHCVRGGSPPFYIIRLFRE
uniref:TIL domain-containing protein n=1 Tax=Caenorhabditis tropicalis TaxID=1561998 RepID=A0A1I7T1R7_9PELO